MPQATRRTPRPGSSDSHAARYLPLPRVGLERSRRHAPSSTESESESDEQEVAASVPFQSVMAADIPHNIRAVLDSMRRNMESNFRTLYEASQTHRAQTGQRFEQVGQRFDQVDQRFEQVDQRFDQMNQRFDQMDRRFDEQRVHIEQYLANRGAIHTHSQIHPVGRCKGAMKQMLTPDKFPTRVHEFLRLKNRSRWPILISLLRFYDIQSWPTWGILSMWSDDESDEEELLAPKHKTLEEAVEFAPGIALQQLAEVIGLDYDKICSNREADERLLENRVTRGKHGLTEESSASKRGKTDEALAQRQATTQLTQQRITTRKPRPSSISTDAVLGWDCRRTEDRTPPEKKPRVQDLRPKKVSDAPPDRQVWDAPPNRQVWDAPPSRQVRDTPPNRQHTLSPTSVATSPGEQIPT